jgi:pimeloyl-ACP methyl ester carboxylesterase
MSTVRAVGPVPANGTSLHVQEAGEGPAVLFIHGMCGDADVWNDQVERLSDASRCVAYDRRGNTRSPLGENVVPTVELHADDAVALIEALGLAPVVVVGSSGGARIGVDVVRRHGALVRGAVLSEPPIFSLLPDRGAGFMADVKPALEAASTPEAAVDAFFMKVDPAVWEALPEPRKDRFRANHDDLFGDLQMPTYAPSVEDLAQIDVPVRVLRGERSRAEFRVVAEILAAAIPTAELVEVRGASHATYFHAPEAFAEAVRSFTLALA